MNRYILRKEKFGGLLYDRKRLDIKILDQKKFENFRKNYNNTDIVINNVKGLNILIAPTKVFLTLTKKCNLNCLHCCNNSAAYAEEELSYQEIQGIITQCKNIGVFEIGLNGGETICHPDFFKIVKTIKEKGLSIYLNTNGVYDGDILEQLSKSGIEKIKVSIDGLEKTNDQIRGRGSFAKAINTIKYLKEKGNYVRINHTLSRKNRNDILNVIKLANELDCSIKIAPLVKAGRAKKLDETVFSILEGNNIEAQIKEYCVLNDIKIHVELRTELLEDICSNSLARFNFQHTECGVRNVHISIDILSEV